MHFQLTWLRVFYKPCFKNLGINIWAPIPIKNAVIHLGMTLDINSVTMRIFKISIYIIMFFINKDNIQFFIFALYLRNPWKMKSAEITSCKLIIARMYKKKWISTRFDPYIYNNNKSRKIYSEVILLKYQHFVNCES